MFFPDWNLDLNGEPILSNTSDLSDPTEIFWKSWYGLCEQEKIEKQTNKNAKKITCFI